MIPIMPLRDILVLPNIESKLLVAREFSLNATYKALDGDDKIILLLQKNIEEDDVKLDSFEEYGILAQVKKIYSIPNKPHEVVVLGLNRIKVTNITKEDGIFFGEYTKIKTKKDLSVEMEKENVEKIFKAASSIMPFNHLFHDEVELGSFNVNSMEELIDNFILKMPFETKHKQYYIGIESLNKRLQTFFEDISYCTQKFFIEKEVNDKLKINVDDAQRKYLLREKLKLLKEELGDEEQYNEDILELEKKLNESKMPSEFKEKIYKEIEKLKSVSLFNPEHNVIQTYIETVLDLPYEKSCDKDSTIKKIKTILDEDHYGLDDVKDAIIEFLSVLKLKEKNKKVERKKMSTVICLAGPPGIGKTSLASSIARATNRKFAKISLGGITDESEIRGHRKTYVGAMPGKIIEAMRRVGVSNPIILLDEIDKMGVYKGDPAAALLEVLDPSQNRKFEDNYIDFPYDLSDVIFICTANNTHNIPDALYDRLEIIELESYTELEKLNIAKNYLIKQVEEETEIKLKLDDETILKIINCYTREAGVRNLKRELIKIARKIAREKLENSKSRQRINEKNLINYLGIEKYLPESISLKEAKIGSVTGLAWTAVGGTTLEVQSVKMKGKGELILTGKLGEVMQESAKVAYSYVRSIKDKFNLKDFENEYDIHLHFPEGAVPKDGPSAGITITTAIISVLANKKVRKDIAMTGEISINGQVLAVGGIKEKVIAAHRIGIREVIIPFENKNDTIKLPKEILDEMKFNYVKDYNEVIDIAYYN